MQVKSILQLTTFKNSLEIQTLEEGLGIYSQSDLVEHKAFRYSEILVYYFNQNRINELDLSHFLNDTALTEDNKQNILTLGLDKIKTIGSETASKLNKINVTSVIDAASYPPFLEAKRNLEKSADTFYEPPSAPTELLPRAIGSTKAAYRYNSFVKDYDEKWSNVRLQYSDDIDEFDHGQIGIRELERNYDIASIFYRNHFRLIMGYIVGFKQSWIHDGVNLGEVIHSLCLAPGESRNIAILDWNRRQLGTRSENTSVDEQLSNEFLQNRLVTETTSAVATEHLTGLTEMESSTKNTSKGRSFGIGGGGSAGGSANIPLQGANATVGALGGIASQFGSGKVITEGEQSGTLITDSTGNREVIGELVQKITDSTVQNASNVRSLMSTIVLDDTQAGSQQGQTRNVTNYNHSHALSIFYYEILQKYIVETKAEKPLPILYLPFNAIEFTKENFEYTIKRYWDLFKKFSSISDEFVNFIDSFYNKIELIDLDEPFSLESFDYIISIIHNEPIKIRLSAYSGRDPKFSIPATYHHDAFKIKIEIKDFSHAFDINPISIQDTLQLNLKLESIDDLKLLSIKLESNFKDSLKRSIKSRISNAEEERHYNERGYNEIADTHDPSKLKEDVDKDGSITFLNSALVVRISFNLNISFKDIHGTKTNLHKNITFNKTVIELFDGPEIYELINDAIKEEIHSDLSGSIQSRSYNTYNSILQHFNEHSYYYTKLLIHNMEKEHLVDIVEQLNLVQGNSSYPLREYIDLNPIGIVDNMLMFKLKEKESSDVRNVKAYSETQRFSVKGTNTGTDPMTFSIPIGKKRRNKISVESAVIYDRKFGGGIKDKREITILANAANNEKYYFKINSSQGSKARVEVYKESLKSTPMSYTVNNFSYNFNDPTKDLKINIPFDTDDLLEIDFSWRETIKPSSSNIFPSISDFIVNRSKNTASILNHNTVKDEVYLPSSGLYAEAILGRSNASEFINPKRFYNWQDSPIPHLAPQIQSINLNQNFANDALANQNPTIPNSVLQQQNPLQYAMPVNTAMQAVQNGAMFRDMNQVGQLTSVMSSLAQLASQTAQLAGTMSGDAAKNALNGAIELGKQVAGMVNNAMNNTSAPPPLTQTEKGAALNILEEIEKKDSPNQSEPPVINAPRGEENYSQVPTYSERGTKQYDIPKAKANVLGTNIEKNDSMKRYHFVFQFLNYDDSPLTGGNFYCELNIEGKKYALNGGNYIQLDYLGKFDEGNYDLPIGTSCMISIHEESTKISGFSDFTLTDKSMLIIYVKINSRAVKKTAESFNSASLAVANDFRLINTSELSEEIGVNIGNDKVFKFIGVINETKKASTESTTSITNTSGSGNTNGIEYEIFYPVHPLIITVR